MAAVETTLDKNHGEIHRGRMLIGSDWSDSVSGDFLKVENPAKKVTAGIVPSGGAADVDRAVKAAAAAFSSWSRVAPRERGRLLLRVADSIEERVETIAHTLALETGNAIRTQSRPEVKYAIDFIRYFGCLGSEIKGETLPLGEQVLSYTRREPLGVVGSIIPWNSPIVIAAAQIATALCAGNTIVLKTAEDAPMAVLLMAEVFLQHLPSGVLNVLTGTGPDCGHPLACHPGVAKLAFTGSTEVGKLIMRAAAERIVPVTLELGGKNPCIVFPDMNEDWVVDGVIAGMRFTRQSQSCTAGSRLLLHSKIFDSFLEKLSKKVKALKIGDPLDEGTDVGTIINNKQFQKVCAYISEGLQQPEAQLVTGGLPPKDGILSEGYYAVPTVLANVSNDWRIAREEIFGPVLVAIPWSDEGEAIRIANDTHYGLAAYVWSRDIGCALRTAHAVEAGWVQVNQGTAVSCGQPYGGRKNSGVGREYSLEGMLDNYTNCKAVTINLNSPPAKHAIQ